MLLNYQQIHALFRSIDAIPEFRGAGVVYIGDVPPPQVLRESAHVSGLKTYIVLEEAEPDTGEGAAVPPPPPAPSRWGSLSYELSGMALNCAGAVVTGIALAGESAAAPLTGGATAPLVWVTGAAALATGAQCGISIGRVYNAFVAPDYNALLDSQEWYQEMASALDWISLAGGVVSLGQAVQAVLRLKQTTRMSIPQILQGMPREARAKLDRELASYKGWSRSKYKNAVRSGKKLVTSAQVTQALKNQLFNSIAAALGFFGSAYSGEVRKYLVSVFQEQ